MALTAVTTKLTRRSAGELAAAIRSGEVSSREAVEAHIERLERVQPKIKPLAAERFAAAREEADAADRRIAEAAPGEDLPPFLGVPCTIKESIEVAGMPNSAGLVARKDYRGKQCAPAAQRIIDAGAIPLGVTNTSELCMWIESNNHVYGRTRNAYDPRRIAGGSSGGEGAAIGSGCAPFGLGSDIGGSIRLPSFFNGIFGHKPSPGLVPNTGQFPMADGEAARMLTIGPMARRAEDLMPVLRAIAGPDGVDPLARSVELGDPAAVDLTGLDVIVTEHSTWLPVAPELREARERAADALAAAGANVRHEQLKELRRAVELYLAALSDGSDSSFKDLLAEAGVEDVRVRTSVVGALRGRGPHTLPTLITVLSERLNDRIPEKRTQKALEAGRALKREVEALIGDGVLLHPPHSRVAPKHGRTVGRAWVLTPATSFSLLQLPVTQVPLGLDWRGLPLGVQVVATQDNDHVAMAVALELERKLGGWIPPGWTEE